ncbi:MAG: alkaline phosphatase family protein [Acidobacteriota bacterium]
MKTRFSQWLIVLVLACLTLTDPFAAAQVQRRAPTANPKAPKLVLLIVIDQFRADYLTRFNHLFGARGFKRLQARSAYFTNANYPYANTLTAVGHTTIVSGSIPAIHGVIGNYWYDREIDRLRSAVSDRQVQGVGTQTAASPAQLLSTTLGDQLRLSNNFQSKSIGISLKDRSAVITAGRRGSAGYWLDINNGNMVTSSHFLEKLPDWVIRFNEQRLADQYFQRRWERKLPEIAYSISDRDDASYEDPWDGNTASFPHLINGNHDTISPAYYEQFKGTPFANDFLAQFSLTAVEQEQLGRDEYTDLLAISFSAPDLAGHKFGPYSQEIEDIIVRLDETLAQFLDALDRRVGLDNMLIALTADHGVAPIPGYAKMHKMGGMRIIGSELRERVEAALDARYGEGNYILALINHQFYLNEKLLTEKGINITQAEELAGHEALKTAGIATYFTRTQLLAGQLPNTEIARRVMTGFHAQRSGNVFLLVEPFVLIAEDKDELAGTAHGTPYHYDTHVPIMISGPGIRPGVYHAPCSPTDIAPTLATLLNIEPPSGSVGRVLSEALQ